MNMIITNGTIVTDRLIPNGTIVVIGDKILYVGDEIEGQRILTRTFLKLSMLAEDILLPA